MERILIIEDDKTIREELSILLTNNNYNVSSIEEFLNIEKYLKEINPDLILLDINLPNTNGYEVIKKIKKVTLKPVIFVTSRNTLEDEIKSLSSGGYDFITKPYNKELLLLKIRKCLDEVNPKNHKELVVNGVVLDLHLSLIKYQDKEIELTRNEFLLMYYLFLNYPNTLSKDMLIEYLWNDKFYLDENILIVNINRLRNKLRDIGLDDFIKTVRGVGYKL
ncbi:MAG TPA: response regulator transcription factor [Candidatus Onthousia excrementipullorum]|uniref:Response regulator transcription factor n=1 Tax=Candidatus Onthousia excrementipullorum TaxID=2840884 RepID=A0A9D1DU57_9FIRM|nr:response regulator transcription factor [Candidatus Onthousia excrementipullorum]